MSRRTTGFEPALSANSKHLGVVLGMGVEPICLPAVEVSCGSNRPRTCVFLFHHPRVGCSSTSSLGAQSGTRTRTPLRAANFKFAASSYSSHLGEWKNEGPRWRLHLDPSGVLEDRMLPANSASTTPRTADPPAKPYRDLICLTLGILSSFVTRSSLACLVAASSFSATFR